MTLTPPTSAVELVGIGPLEKKREEIIVWLLLDRLHARWKEFIAPESNWRCVSGIQKLCCWEQNIEEASGGGVNITIFKFTRRCLQPWYVGIVAIVAGGHIIFTRFYELALRERGGIREYLLSQYNITSPAQIPLHPAVEIQRTRKKYRTPHTITTS